MDSMVTRRAALLRLTATGLAVLLWPRRAMANQAKIPMVVYKDPSCGCCHKWVQHMEANGFTASVTDTSNMNPIKTRYHVTDKLASCHTAVVGGYTIEGHVPAEDIKRLLAQKPKITGLAIPGMPASAPGMDATPFVPYTVLSFDEKGATAVFAKHDRA
jgi:hypothetical protein